jgi:hypothetical protein
MDKENNVREADAQAKTNELLGPGHFFWVPKTSVSIVSYREAEVYSVTQLMEYVDLLERKYHTFPEIAIQKKYDGDNIEFHRDTHGKFTIFTDNGSTVTNRVPGLIKLSEKLFSDKSYILIGELEGWSHGVHSGREQVSGYLNAQTPPNDSTLCISFFDCVWFDGKDLHGEPYNVRYGLLEKEFKISQSLITNLQPGFNLAPTFIVKAKAALQSAVQQVVRPRESEGAVLKIWNGFKFSLNKSANEMIKFKKWAEAHFVVLQKRQIAGSKQTFQYWIGIKVLVSERDTVVQNKVEEYGGQNYLRCAKTFNTNVQAKVGDIITVRFSNVFVYHEQDKIYFGIYAPNVYENRTVQQHDEEPDTVSTLLRIGEESGLIVQKGIGVFISKATDAFMQYPPEAKPCKYVMQEHFRGKTAHIDFRIQSISDTLIGYTIMNQVEGKIKTPILNVAQGRKVLKQSDNWKFDAIKGIFQRRRIAGGEIRFASLQVALKQSEPENWLSVEGVSEVGGTGATSKWPGVFVIASQGQLAYGYREVYFHEYFVYNDKWPDGGLRMLFRLLSGPELQQASIPISNLLEPFTDEPDKFTVENNEIIFDNGTISMHDFEVDRLGKSLHKILPPSEEPGREMPFVWLLVKPKTNEPYILSARARLKKKYSPVGVSTLPASVKKQIPASLRYWEASSSQKMQAMLDELRDKIKGHEVELDYSDKVVFKRASSFVLEKAAESSYILKRRWWRGPIVIRLGSSAEFYDLYFQKDQEWDQFILTQNPVNYDSFAGWLRINITQDEVNFEGTLPPGHELNPNKKLAAETKIVGSGTFSLNEISRDVWQLEFKDGTLKDRSFTATRDAGIWKFSLG